MQARMAADASGNAAGGNEGFNREWSIIESKRIVKRGVTETIGHTLRTACGVDRDFLAVHFADTQAVAIMAREFHRCA